MFVECTVAVPDVRYSGRGVVVSHRCISEDVARLVALASALAWGASCKKPAPPTASDVETSGEATSPKMDAPAASPMQGEPSARDASVVSAEPQPPIDASADALVDVSQVDPTIRIDIRYATANNFAKVAVYPVGRCLLRRDVAARLSRVQRELARDGVGLKVWDCYRPISVQQKFWELVPDERYVAKPVVKDGVAVNGSKHNRGAAVDLTLVDAAGIELEMPTGYDDFSNKAHRNYRGGSDVARANRQRLERAMVAQGFEPLPTEWWHFDGPGWKGYPLSDEPLE
jgi:beta-N-acetylhexosaminidase/D-alanyl-D-alanine dipeptidase